MVANNNESSESTNSATNVNTNVNNNNSVNNLGNSNSLTSQLLLAEQELSSLLARKKQVDRNLASLEVQIYHYESSYLEETRGIGNIIKGFDGFLTGAAAAAVSTFASDPVGGISAIGSSNNLGKLNDGLLSSSGLAGGGSGSSSNLLGQGGMRRKRGAAAAAQRDAERIFSNSSLTYPKALALMGEGVPSLILGTGGVGGGGVGAGASGLVGAGAISGSASNAAFGTGGDLASDDEDDDPTVTSFDDGDEPFQHRVGGGASSNAGGSSGAAGPGRRRRKRTRKSNAANSVTPILTASVTDDNEDGIAMLGNNAESEANNVENNVVE